MKIIKNFMSFFSKKNDTPKPNISKKNNVKSINGQNVIYFNSFLNKNKYIKIAIGLSIFLFSFILIISHPILLIEDEIYSDNFKYDTYGVTRSMKKQELAFKYFINKDFENSFKLYGEIKDSTNLNKYYYAISAMIIDEQELAQKEWKSLKYGDNLFQDDAQWFLALSMLKTDKNGAIEEFKLIAANPNHCKSEKAKEILEMLN